MCGGHRDTQMSRDVDRGYDHQSEDAATSRTSLEAATEAAQRINALLIAKGMLKPSQVSSVPHKTKQVILRQYAVLCECELIHSYVQTISHGRVNVY